VIALLLVVMLGCSTRRDVEQTREQSPYWGLREEVLEQALSSYRCARSKGLGERGTLTIIDFERPSTERRLWVIDTREGELLHRELVAHGRNTGEDLATEFSNIVDSKQSSIGLFVTAETYTGKNGLSLRLDGLEPSNDRARERYIVIHGADYVSEAHIEEYGRLGRSWGCPALPPGTSKAIIERIAGGTLVFAYYPDRDWLQESPYLHCR
jgi:hypothetical protein